MCVWSLEPPPVIKDYMLQCFLPCQLHYLWYGNAEDQSYIVRVTSDGMSGNTKIDLMLSNFGAKLSSLVVSTEFMPMFKMLNQPLSVITITSLSILLFHILEFQKLASTSPLNLTIMKKCIQTSSCQGQKRSFSTFKVLYCLKMS